MWIKSRPRHALGILSLVVSVHFATYEYGLGRGVLTALAVFFVLVNSIWLFVFLRPVSKPRSERPRESLRVAMWVWHKRDSLHPDDVTLARRIITRYEQQAGVEPGTFTHENRESAS